MSTRLEQILRSLVDDNRQAAASAAEDSRQLIEVMINVRRLEKGGDGILPADGPNPELDRDDRG